MADDEGQSGPAVVPPPPSAVNDRSSGARAEVLIRTMASDIRMLGQSGGVSPQGETVAIALASRARAAAPGKPADRRSAARLILIALIALAAVGVLFYLGYAVLPTLFSSNGTTAGPPAAVAPNNAPALPAPANLPVYLGHQSYFRTPADATTSYTFAALGGSADPASFSAGITAALAAVAPSATLVEVAMQAEGKPAISWTEFLAARRAGLIDSDFFRTRFEDDFTAFAYRTGDDPAIGYVLKLQKNQTPIVLRAPVEDGIESNPDAVRQLFVTPPAGPAEPYGDIRISGQLARRAAFGDQEFVYGWFYNTYLVLATSADGLREAVLRL
jgi:hypothetical protein